MSKSQRQNQKIQTRKHLIDRALDQFAKDGLMTTRTSDIASAAKVSHGTVFAHFPTREILLDAVIEEFGTRITRRLHELVNNHGDMKEVLEAHLKGISEYEDFYTRLASEGHLLHESARNAFVMIQSAVSYHIIQVAEREIEDCKVRSIPVELLFNTWVGLIHYYLVNRDLFAPGESVLKRYGVQWIEHYINLIKIKEGDH
ncbi:TetR/AcrR family transcriptional regulator [Geosporobacter ferrireducens]|uniref:TetR family transcriptional regulator n=1 Tax=Geosporobacter ferrireducens TaxID=1424294 RepID=A0A1D8GMD5_9FIRM|nr:TetR/AcrR family transcriptional regulator [Geosporobacter ferrireducens]AOT72055.1 TetR family transcriptional regulator [Geosporobacter ferrireducens]MTI55939.1 TetR/AcrR family transcriptional regulator [Geosporobacter ferrireducens]